MGSFFYGLLKMLTFYTQLFKTELIFDVYTTSSPQRIILLLSPNLAGEQLVLELLIECLFQLMPF